MANAVYAAYGPTVHATVDHSLTHSLTGACESQSERYKKATVRFRWDPTDPAAVAAYTDSAVHTIVRCAAAYSKYWAVQHCVASRVQAHLAGSKFCLACLDCSAPFDSHLGLVGLAAEAKPDE